MDTNNKKPNKYNSPCVQALLDIKRILSEELYQLDELNIADLLEVLTEDTEHSKMLRDKTDNLMNIHRFPDRSLTFIQSLNYNACPQRYSLSRLSLLIYDFLERSQDQTGLVIIEKGKLAAALHLTDTEKRNIEKSLQELVQKNFLEVIFKPKKGSKLPGHYKVNPAVSWTGRRQINDSLKMPEESESDLDFKIIRQQIILPDGKKAFAGVLEETKKEADDCDSPTPLKYEISTFSNNDNKSTTGKNQEKVIFEE